jgi:pyruvate formate lyase activating enzyme
VLRDAPFYEDGGGLTLTGGEPTLQPAFALALLRLAKAEHVDTALETSGNAPWESLETLLPYVDLWLFDVKHLNSQAHRRYTGLGNELILSNLRKLAGLGAPIRVRVPLIPEVNLSEENLRQTAAFVEALGTAVRSVDLLPFHKLGTAKYQALGRTPLWPDPNLLSDDRVRWAAEQMRPYKIKVRIVGDRA